MSIHVGKTGTLRLTDDELKELRLQCLRRDNFRCQDCGRPVSRMNFHMAHVQGRGAGGSDALDNVRTLCGEDGCHRREHNPKSVGRKA